MLGPESNTTTLLTPSASKYLLSNPNSSHPHPSADTHTRNANLLPRPLQLRQQRAHLPRTRNTKGMSKRNRSTLGVHLLYIDAELLDTEQALTRKRLVDLPDVDIVRAEAGLLENGGNGSCGSDAHE